MKKAQNQDEKVSKGVAILQILQRYSDQDHYLTQNNIIEYLLSDYGINIERKAVSRNLNQIQAAGHHIVHVNKKDDPLRKGGYYLKKDQELTDAQWRIILSAINAASFVTKKDTEQMNQAISRYVSTYHGHDLKANMLVSPRKTTNTAVTDNISLIGKAIQECHPITFRYIDYYVKGEAHYLSTKEPRHFIPCATNWQDDRFYVIGKLMEDDPRFPKDSPNRNERFFRIDKMENIQIDESQTVDNQLENLDHYADQMIGFFKGEISTIRCAVTQRGLSLVLDRFAEEANDIKVGTSKDPHYEYEISFNVEVSPTFYGWMTQLGTNIKILSPRRVVEEYTNRMKEIQDLYSN